MTVSAPERSPAPIDDGVIEEARRRRRERRMRNSLVGGVLVAGLIVSLAVVNAGGTAARGPARRSDSLATRRHDASLRVALSPNLEPGRPGWCVSAALRNMTLGFGCASLLTENHPFLGEGWAWGRGARYATSLVLTAPQVKSVLFNGKRIPTRAASGVPFGLRVAVVERPVPIRPSPRSGRLSLVGRKQLVPGTAQVITVDGRSFTEGGGAREAMPVHYWHLPGVPAHGLCELHASALSSLSAEWGGVVTAMSSSPRQIVGDGLVPCIETGYSLGGYAIQAAVLLDASDPGRKRPGPIPGLVGSPQQPGLYSTASSLGYVEQISAERQGNAWIVVAGGGHGATGTRITLLHHLRASVRL